MQLLTTVLSRPKIAEFIGTEEGRRAFENAQRDIVTLYPSISYLDADVTTSTGALEDTMLRAGIVRGQVYIVEAVLTFQSASTTNGIGVALKVPLGAEVIGSFTHNTTALASETVTQNASSTISSPTTGVLTANVNVPLIGKWLVKANDSFGDIVLQVRSELAANVITLKGGLCVLRSTQVV